MPTGDEIIVAGRLFPTGTRVVTWREAESYNAYRGTEPPRPRHGLEKSRGDLAALQRTVDQFVLHYDGAGVSRVCFSALQQRKLSVHFLLDIDGTVYQTLDLEERASHATIANDRSIGIEIANIGAFPPGQAKPLTEWYRPEGKGVAIAIPSRFKNLRIRTPHFTGRPARPELIRGAIHGSQLVQYDLTPQQYQALAKLTAALGRAFPQMTMDFPRDAQGRLLTRQLTEEEFRRFRGVLGHFHVQANKVDPGPAFQWHEFIAAVRRERR